MDLSLALDLAAVVLTSAYLVRLYTEIRALKGSDNKDSKYWDNRSYGTVGVDVTV